MIITDTNKIDRAIPRYPDIMAPEAETLIKMKYEQLQSREEELNTLRMRERKLVETINKLKEEFKVQASLFDIQYGKKNIKEIKEDVNIGIINREDYRNKA